MNLLASAVVTNWFSLSGSLQALKLTNV